MGLFSFLKRDKSVGETSKATNEVASPTDQAVEISQLVDNLEVRTMPDQFLGIKHTSVGKSEQKLAAAKVPVTPKDKLAKPPALGLKRNIIIGIVLIVVLGGAMALAAFFFVQGIETEEDGEPGTPIASTQTNLDSPAVVSRPSPSQPQPPAAPACPLCDFTTCPFGCELDINGCWTGAVCLPAPPPEPEPGQTGPGPKEPIAPTPTTTPEQIAAEPDAEAEELSRQLPSAEDVDTDGLSEAEEGLLGTDPQISDSDSDGFTDGSEVVNLYDPNFGSGARLRDSNRIRSAVSVEFNYVLLVPIAWDEEVLVEADNQVRYTADTGEFFSIIVEDNTADFATAREWYSTTFPGIPQAQLTDVRGETLAGMLSPDGLAAYFVSPRFIYTISYNPGLREELNFSNIFRMMLQSFSLFNNPLAG